MKDIINRRDYLTKKEHKTISNLDKKNIFTEQRRRLAQQLNDFPYYNSPSSLEYQKGVIKTRKQSKKQKKINSVLKEINYIYENDTSLKEDTNLRLLKNMSRVREYKNNYRKRDNNSSHSLFLKELNKKKLEKESVGIIPVITQKELDEEKTESINATYVPQSKGPYVEDTKSSNEYKKLPKRKKIKRDIISYTGTNFIKEKISDDIKTHTQSLKKFSRLNRSIIFLSVIFLIILISLFFTMITYLNI